MASLSDVRNRVYRLLSDASAQQFSAELIDDGINAALVAILPWIFKKSTETLTGDGTETEFELPEDLYRVIAVLDEDTGLFIPQNSLSAGQSPGSDILSNQDWLEYPEGSISFANPPGSDVILYYGATWASPVDDDDELECPPWLSFAITYYAASYTLLDKASSASNIRQWNVSVDSGTPVMNPMKDMSTYFLERFRIEMDRVPSRMRGVHG
jgi:hypothetical protein